jgi:hypothetical protein
MEVWERINELHELKRIEIKNEYIFVSFVSFV